jgi:murein DD-endopeptidase MepM/ murein hydrolase activator NlpD
MRPVPGRIGSGDMSEMLDRRYYVSRVFNVDSELLTQLRTAQEAVARERRALVTRRTELAEAHRDNALRVQRVAEEANEREELLKEVRKERTLQEQRLAELEEDSNEVQRSLESELARRLANPRGFRDLGKWSGSLMRPVPGRIASGFGARYHPILHYTRMHTGVDLSGGTGTPVRAAATGEVFSASWRGGYGQCIILLHGGGMSTLYGHLSRISVRPGQGVKRGQVIGAIGSTGLATGPHLHFELRRNGAPVNPL